MMPDTPWVRGRSIQRRNASIAGGGRSRKKQRKFPHSTQNSRSGAVRTGRLGRKGRPLKVRESSLGRGFAGDGRSGPAVRPVGCGIGGRRPEGGVEADRPVSASARLSAGTGSAASIMSPGWHRGPNATPTGLTRASQPRILTSPEQKFRTESEMGTSHGGTDDQAGGEGSRERTWRRGGGGGPGTIRRIDGRGRPERRTQPRPRVGLRPWTPQEGAGGRGPAEVPAGGAGCRGRGRLAAGRSGRRQ